MADGRQAPPLNAAQVLTLGFAIAILLGAVLLSFPFAVEDGQPLRFVDALFTATSAVCVTGLTVVDTAGRFSLFGELVILTLFQVGGLGIMTMSTMIALLTGKRLGLRERLLIQKSMGHFPLAGLVRLTKSIIIMAFAIEALGALLLAARFSRDFPLGRALYLGLFHSVSAFNNAGFDLFHNSLERYVADPLVSLVVPALIILGGIGFTVVADIHQRRNQPFRWSLHTKIVLMVSLALLVLGTIVVLFVEWNNPHTLGKLGVVEKLMASFFHSVTPRTAGFNTLPTGQLRSATLLFTIFLMFVGGSPASAAGGIKTSTLGAILASTWATLTGKDEVEAYSRRLERDIVDRSLAIAFVALAVIVVVTFTLLVTEGQPLMAVLFEATSAFGTVGLSMGITDQLTTVGRTVIIMTMFIGRLGPIVLAGAIASSQQRKQRFRHPSERIIVG